MGITKSNIFTEEQNRLAQVSKVLGHPARIAIIEYLAEKNTCICGEIVDEIGLAQPTISQHLKELKNIGLVKGDIDGARVCYCIDTKVLGEVKELLGGFISKIIKATNCC